MRLMTRAGLVLATTTLLAAGATAPAQGVDSHTYQGTWETATDCFGSYDASGRWTVNLQPGGTAVVHVTVFIEGFAHHASWGGKALGTTFVQQPTSGSEVFDVVGGDLEFVLTDSGDLTYTISNYPCGGASTTAVLTGTLRH